MKCEFASDSLPLYLYGELTLEEQEELEQHLDGCSDCRRELERQKALHRALDARELAAPGSLLAACRQDLMRAVDRGKLKSPHTGWRQGLALTLATVAGLRQPAGALALIALGFFAARITQKAPTALIPNVSSQPSEAVISTIRSVQPDASGEVQIAVDETRRRIIRGNPNDTGIQRLLLAAAQDESNPGLRVESVDLLKDQPNSAEVRNALLQALQTDPNPGVRLKALDGLKTFASDAQTRRVLTQVLLSDDNPGVRVQAIDLLMQRRDDSLVGMLQNLVRREDNNYVRLRCARALQEMNASVGTF